MTCTTPGYPAIARAWALFPVRAWGLMPRDLLANVYVPDSWVLGIETADGSVCFLLDAIVQEGHERYFWPPREGEQYPYVRLRWCLRGRVRWNEGPNLDHPATDARGETDLGNIDAWLQSGDRHTLEGDWGCVVIDGPVESIEYLDDLPVKVLDGSRVTDFASFVEEANHSIFPGYVESVGRPWSGSLDALNDILRGGMGTPDGGFVFRFENSANIRTALGYAETTRWLEEMLERCHPTNRETVAGRIERARRNEGETLFDVVVEIIRIHGPGGSESEDSVLLALDD